MLARLSGRSHSVLTGICLCRPGQPADASVVETQVRFVQLSREVCEAYLATDEPWDKAGGYAIQGLAGAFVNVVGLPLTETWQLLQSQGIATGLEGRRE